MGRRRKARILALQALYQVDLAQVDTEEALALLSRDSEIPEDVQSFAEVLAKGVSRRVEEIDRLIRTTSDNWRLERMALVDRNILRLAVYELLCHPEIPERVTINEAIELGKLFSSEESGAFINGILDQIRISLHPLRAEGSP